jgi:hypothetical protein
MSDTKTYEERLDEAQNFGFTYAACIICLNKGNESICEGCRKAIPTAPKPISPFISTLKK